MREDLQPPDATSYDDAPIPFENDLDLTLGRRLPIRARLLICALLAALVAAILIPLWRALPSQALPAGASAGHTTALILSNVSSGVVTFDGQRISYHTALVVNLHPETNTITFDAPPFLPRSCALTWPAASATDTCHGPDQNSPFYPHPPTIEVNGKPLRPDYIISFPLALPDLQAALRSQPLAYARQLLAQEAATWPATVLPGEHYAASMNAQDVTTAGVAPEPLHAIPTYVVDTTGAINGCSAELCATTGGAGDLAHPQSGGPLRWAVTLPVYLEWRFTPPSATTTASVRFPQLLDLLLTYTAAAGWRLADSAGAPGDPGATLNSEIVNASCVSGEFMVMRVAPQFANLGDDSHITSQGCVITTSGLATTNNVTTTATTTTFIWRFGVLLAADVPTSQLVPQVPLATPAERAAVLR